VGVDSSGNVYIADTQTNAVRKVTASTGIITTVAGTFQHGFSGDGGSATQASVSQPNSVAVDQSGILYIADTGNNRIRSVNQAQVISTSAGNGEFSPISSGISATSAPIATSFPTAIVANSAGDIYFADALNNVIRRVSATNSTISVVAGTGEPGYTGDGGSATDAELNSPGGLAIDQGGNLYVADSNNNVVRKVNAATGIITTFAGNGTLGFGGDGGPATDAPLIRPEGLVVDGAGNVYIATPEVSVVRIVTHQGTIYTEAGNGVSYRGVGPNGDGGPANEAELGYPASLAVDQLGNLYIGDQNNDVVREVNSTTGLINTIAGTGQFGESGDGGPALEASIGGPVALSTDSFGNLYLADGYEVRAINSAGIINTVIGQGGYGYSGDGGLVAAAQSSAVGVAVDGASNIYFADIIGDRIHKISTASTTQKATATPVFAPAADTSGSTQTVTISDTTPGAQIFYTLDGSAPTPAYASLYENPLSLLGSVALSAVAIAPGRSVSGVASDTYTFPNLGKALISASRSRVPAQAVNHESQTHGLAVPQPLPTIVGKAGQHDRDSLMLSRRLVYRYRGQTMPQ
jgi:sugar lactone lactonase YvrE